MECEYNRSRRNALPLLPFVQITPPQTPNLEEAQDVSLKSYLKKEESKGKKIMKHLKFSDVIRMSVEKERTIFNQYKNNSFYNVHMLLRYKSDFLSSSYRHPSKRAPDGTERFDRLRLPAISLSEASGLIERKNKSPNRRRRRSAKTGC